MRITYENSWAHVEDGTLAELEFVDDYLSVPVGRYDPQLGFVEDRHRMLSEVGHRFAAGLVPLLCKGAADAGYAVELEDQRMPVAGYDPACDVSWFRDYQHAAFADLLKAQRGICWAPTGAGKTELIVGLTRAYPVEFLMLCHRSDLVDQAAERYRLRTGERAGTFDSGGWRKGSCNFTVATFQAVYRAISNKKGKRVVIPLLEGVHGLIIDEVHGVSAASYYRTTQAFVNAYYRFGFSGTPMHRSEVDAMKMMGSIGPVVARVSYAQLIAAGVLARPIARMVKCFQNPPATGGNWRNVYEMLVVRSRARNRLIAECAERSPLPCLVFVDEIAQGQNVLRHLLGAGLRADFTHGGDPTDRRKKSLRAISEGELDVLVCSVIFQEGIDLPELRSVVVGGGKMSAVAVLQRIGRGMRKAPGKSEFEVWDILDEGQKWLTNHALTRHASMVEAGIPVEVLDSL